MKFIPQIEVAYEELKMNNFDFLTISDLSKSWFLFTDICPLCIVLLCITLIIDPTRKAARAIAPTSILGAIFTFIGFLSSDTISFTWKCLFVMDSAGNRCNILYHSLLMFLSVGVLINTPKFTFKGWLSAFIFYVSMLLYFVICCFAAKLDTCAGGVTVADWERGGTFHSISNLLHIPPAACPYIFVPFCVCFASLIIFINDYALKTGSWNYGNVASKKWYFWYDYNTYSYEKLCKFERKLLYKKQQKKIKNYN